MGNTQGKQSFYEKKTSAGRLTKKWKNRGYYNGSIFKNRYTGTPIYQFADIFDPGTNLISKSDECYPKNTKQKNDVSSMYLDTSNIRFPINGKKEFLRSRNQYPSKRYRIDLLNSKTPCHYFPSKTLQCQNFSNTIPCSNSVRHNSIVSNTSCYNSSPFTLLDETLPTLSSYSTRLSNKRLTSSSNVDFGLISPGVLRVVNGNPSPCSSDDELSLLSFSQGRSLPYTIEENKLKRSVTPEPKRIVSEDMLKHTPSPSSTTEELLKEYYDHKDKNTDDYFQTDGNSKMTQFNHILDKSKQSSNPILKTKNSKQNYPITYAQDEIRSKSFSNHTHEHKNNNSIKHLRKLDVHSKALKDDSLNIFSKINNSETHTNDFLQKKSGIQERINNNQQQIHKNTKSYLVYNNIDIPSIPSIPNLFVSDQRIAISG
ncbi:hypothetical protein PNEG_02224 [Pneumocystis murina B123]|uniref:Uncharacterized protein n=1 Tax=Pneumocystis murina (strain B123) TaxID=1069680 RepID=M7NR94_PNEMU|nr:hypothetical protein PNEG_02224 [Pneumocystis murina B123]EMR09641.1 hypothetical protein PNEG_02224 [Pneumocystis murina B123]